MTIKSAVLSGSGARQNTSHLTGSESQHAAGCTQAMQGLDPTDATIQPPVPPQPVRSVLLSFEGFI